MAVVKPFATYQEQIEKLKSKGCIIDDEDTCLKILENINYYRFTAYLLPFKKNDGTYSDGTNFYQIYRIYEFDRKLRNIIFSAIEVTEISIRTKLAYYHSKTYGPLGYLSSESFNKDHDSEKFLANLNREINNNNKVLFVKHHLEHYDKQFPLWVVTELFTFGMLSYFYNDLKTIDKKAIAGVHYKEMVSWLRCCTDLRNICAHYGRLYLRTFAAIPAGLSLEPNQERKLWGAIKSLKALYPDQNKWLKEFVIPLFSLVEEYQDAICLSHIAFPENWYEQLSNE